MIHTCYIRELTYPPLGLLVFWLYIFLGVCSLCISWPLGSWWLEYIYALLSLGHFIFGMPGILSPVLVLVWTLVLDLGASQPLTVLVDLGMVIFRPLLHLWRPFIPFARSLHQWSPSWGVVVDAWMLGLHLTFLFMSHCSLHCFLWVQLSWSFLPISHSLDSLLNILGCFGLYGCHVGSSFCTPSLRFRPIHSYHRYHV